MCKCDSSPPQSFVWYNGKVFQWVTYHAKHISSTGREWGVELMHTAILRMCQGRMGKLNRPFINLTKFFKIEQKLQELSPEEYYEQRQLQAELVIEAFYDFLGRFIPMKDKLQTAGHYVLNEKQELMTFLKDGRLEASNNRAECAIKTVVIRRKNYLFSTSLEGAEANAIIYSIIPWQWKIRLSSIIAR